MKRLVLIVVFFLCGFKLTTACDRSTAVPLKKPIDVILCGQIREISIKKALAIEHISAVIDFRLINRGATSIVVVPASVRVLGGSGSLSNGGHFADYGTYGNSTIRSYDEVMKVLGRPNSQTDSVQIIPPQGSWVFTRSLSLELDRPIVDAQASWMKIRDNSPLFLRIRIATVDSMLRREKELIRGRDVWPEIQKKWTRFGHLLIDDLTSEPIRLDLSTAVVTTEALP